MKFKSLLDGITKDYPFDTVYEEYFDGTIDKSKYGKDVDIRDIEKQTNRISVSLFYPSKINCTHMSIYDDSIDTKVFENEIKNKCEELKSKIPNLR